jgi:hypothetical protein
MGPDRVAVLCPTRGRDNLCATLIDSVIGTSEADVILYVDDDDISRPTGLGKYGNRVHVVVGPRLGPCKATNALVSEYPEYSAYGFVPDDCTMMSMGWDAYLLEKLAAFPGRIGVVSPAFNHEPFGQCVDIPFVSSEWVDTLGWFSHPKFQHWCGHTLLAVLGHCTELVFAPKDQFYIDHSSRPSHNQEHITRDSVILYAILLEQMDTMVCALRSARGSGTTRTQ